LTFESEPFNTQLDTQQPDNEPVLPEKPRTWTPPFRFLVALVALVGLAATLYGVAGRPLGNISYPSSQGVEYYVLAGEQAAFLLTCLFLAVCVAGLWLTRRSGALLRIGLILRAVALLGVVLQTFPVAAILFGGYYSVISLYLLLTFLYTPPYMEFFQLALGILALLSQLCFSYGLARWQASDKVFIWVQIAFSLGLVGLVIQQTPSYFFSGTSWSFALQIVGGAFLSGAATACFLLRLACWRVSPLIVLCFTVGVVLSLIFSEVVDHFFYGSGSITHLLQTSYAINLAGSTLFILGAILLIQKTRGHKPVDAPNLAGDEAQMTQPEQDAPGPAAGEGQG
jgi:hypothetical protein